MRLFVFLSVAVSLLMPSGAVVAQQSTPAATSQRVSIPITPGTRVRVYATTLLTPLIANFFEMRGDTAVFIENSQGRGLWAFNIDQITKLERSLGEQSGDRGLITRGALLGAAGGAALFYGFAALFEPSDSTRRFNRVATMGIGAAVGAGAGAYLYSRRTTERWGTVPVPHRVSVVPGRRGVNVGLGWAF